MTELGGQKVDFFLSDACAKVRNLKRSSSERNPKDWIDHLMRCSGGILLRGLHQKSPGSPQKIDGFGFHVNPLGKHWMRSAERFGPEVRLLLSHGPADDLGAADEGEVHGLVPFAWDTFLGFLKKGQHHARIRQPRGRSKSSRGLYIQGQGESRNF